MVLNDTYRLQHCIGSGGMGEVWKAEHLRLPKPVAIKVLRPSVDRGQEAEARFRREAEIGSRLQNPHIVHVFDFNELDDGRKYIAMDFLQGESLKDRLKRGPVSVAEVVHIMDQTAQGLRVAHEAGVVHRDLKPDNLFLVEESNEDPPFRVTILDFGISKIQTETAITRDSVVIGTPGYMAPEQALGRTALMSAASDQFSLATIAYEMLTGSAAFGGNTLAEIVYKVVHEIPEPVAALQPSVPKHCSRAIAKAMAKSPDQRFPDVTAFVSALSGRGAAEAKDDAIAAAQTNPSWRPKQDVDPEGAAALASIPQLAGTDPTISKPPPPRLPRWEFLIGPLAVAVLGIVIVGLNLRPGPGAGGSAPTAPPGGGGSSPTTQESEVPADDLRESDVAEGVPAVEADGAPDAASETPVQQDTAAVGAGTADTASPEVVTPSTGGPPRGHDGPAVETGGPPGPGNAAARALLASGNQALAAQNPSQALHFAERSFREHQSGQAVELMVKAYCQQRNLALANARARGLGPAAQRRVTRYCARLGVHLAI